MISFQLEDSSGSSYKEDEYQDNLGDLRFPRWWLWRLRYWMWRCVDWYKFTNISQDTTVPIFYSEYSGGVGVLVFASRNTTVCWSACIETAGPNAWRLTGGSHADENMYKRDVFVGNEWGLHVGSTTVCLLRGYVDFHVAFYNSSLREAWNLTVKNSFPT